LTELLKNENKVNFDSNQQNLTNNEKSQINKLLNTYSYVFSKDKYDLGSINIENCKIELTNNIPINLRPYRASQEDQKLIDNVLKILLEKNLIRKSLSSYSFPITLVDKKDEGKKSRICIDFRKLNLITIADNYPFPRLDDIIDKLHDCEYYTTLDITSGFWHIKVEPKDIHKTAFVTMNDHYEWLVMPFGFRNSPAVFQRVIRNILKKHNLTLFSDNYLDDILIYSKSFKEHLKHIELVLKALIEENVKLKLSKCSFGEKQVKYLGHCISKNQIKPLSDNIKAIIEFPTPKTVKNIQQFLGKVNFYHKFIPNVPKLLNPLYLLLQKNSKFIWSNECELSFNTIKKFLISSPILAIYNPNEECILYTDASKIGLGAVLKQKQLDNKLHPIGYFSKKLLNYQKNYSITELECLAIIESIEYWHHYLYGKKFSVITDHNALKWLKTIKKPNSRLFNWSLKLSQYNIDIKYQSGKNNIEADCLSRNPIIDSNENIEYLKIVNLLTKDELIEAQRESYPNVKELPKKCKVENDLIVRLKNNFKKVLVPEKLRFKLIDNFHIKFGHIGTKKLLQFISKCYIWPNITNDIKDYIDSCSICQTNKIQRMKKFGSLSQLGPAEEPFDIISIDTVGGFNGYNSTKQYIHLAIDHFTRYLWTLSSKTQSSKDFINLIKSVSNTNKPKRILADSYTGIKSKEFVNYLEKQNIKIMFTTVNCPQSNGMCERVNQTIVTRLRCKINEQLTNVCWPKLLTNVTEEYNNSPHSVTTFTPKYLMFGIKPFELIVSNSYPNLEEARKIAFEKSRENHNQNKLYYDKKHNPITLSPGDLVYVENKNDISRKKLEPLMIGPFKVLKKLSDISYEVESEKRGKSKDVFHISKLRIYKKRNEKLIK
jgi:transposase InsO family protein